MIDRNVPTDDPTDDPFDVEELPLTDPTRYVFVATVYDDKSLRDLRGELGAPRPDGRRGERSGTVTGAEAGGRRRPGLDVAWARRRLEERDLIEPVDDGHGYRPGPQAPDAVDPDPAAAAPETPVDIDEALEDPGYGTRIVYTLLANEGPQTHDELETKSLGEEAVSSSLDVGIGNLLRRDAARKCEREYDGEVTLGFELVDEREWEEPVERSGSREGGGRGGR